MAVLLIVSLVLTSVLTTVYFTAKTRTTNRIENTTESPTRQHSRGEYALSILFGYAVSALVTMVLLLIDTGLHGSPGIFFTIFMATFFAAPVFVSAIIVGYPVYRFIRTDSLKFLTIWIACSCSAIAAAAVVAITAAIFTTDLEYINLPIIALLCVPSLIVAIPTSLFIWYRK